MIEREFVAQKTKEYYIQKYIEQKLNKVGISSIRLKKIPLGEKIIIDTSRPSLIVGSKGANIRELTKVLKRDFQLENPQIEINEVRNIFLDAHIVAEKISDALERFGSARFKSVGHKMMENVMNSGALGVEIVISGKIPSARAKSWRFYEGYLKKSGSLSITGVRKAQKFAKLKSGVVGIKVAIMPPDLELPDKVQIMDEAGIQSAAEERAADNLKKEEKAVKKKAPAKKRTPKKDKEEKKVETKSEEKAESTAPASETTVEKTGEAQ